VKPVRPSKPEARDEDPRLIPLADKEETLQHAQKLNHYIKLADLALAQPTKNKN
jgi:hypothetical protein